MQKFGGKCGFFQYYDQILKLFEVPQISEKNMKLF